MMSCDGGAKADYGDCERCGETVPRGVLVRGFVRMADGAHEVVWCVGCWQRHDARDRARLIDFL